MELMDARRGGQIGISSFAVLLMYFGGIIPLVHAAPPQETAITALPVRQEEERGFDHFYNLEYDQAIAVFQKLRDADP